MDTCFDWLAAGFGMLVDYSGYTDVRNKTLTIPIVDTCFDWLSAGFGMLVHYSGYTDI